MSPTALFLTLSLISTFALANCREALVAVTEQSSTGKTIFVPENKMNAVAFEEAFTSLIIPITTANEQLIPGWKPQDVWNPYIETVKDFCFSTPSCRELISIVMVKSIQPDITTESHRKLLEGWVKKHVPGFELLWEENLLPLFNRHIEEFHGSKLHTYEYGKDGEGAFPDLIYQTVVRKGYIPVGNHHDIIGHLALYALPEVRELTKRISSGFSDAQILSTRIKAHAKAIGIDYRNVHGPYLNFIQDIYTKVWNLAQEKLYISQVSKSGKSKLSLMGAFNSVYNTIFDVDIGINGIASAAAGLGLFNANPLRSLVIHPQTLRTQYVRPAHPSESQKVSAARQIVFEKINDYENVWLKTGVNPAEFDQAAVSERFRVIVKDTLFATWPLTKIKKPMEKRWELYSQAITKDPVLSKFFQKEAMLQVAEKLMIIGESLKSLEEAYYNDLGPKLSSSKI